MIPRKKIKDSSKGNGEEKKSKFPLHLYPNLNKKKQNEQDQYNLLTEMQRSKARPNRIFMLQVLYNSPLLLGDTLSGRKISRNAFYQNTDDVIHYPTFK